MAWLRHPALIRTLTLGLLLWVGGDIGAHGLFASDFSPIVVSGSSVHPSDDGGRATVPDHCFCHSISMAAGTSTVIVGLTPSGTLVLYVSPQVPLGNRHPLDRPPQPIA
jgi:hypothetical protein